MITVHEAAEMGEARKLAARGLTEPVLGSTTFAGKQVQRRIFSGFDVDPDELFDLQRNIAPQYLVGMSETGDYLGVIAGCWQDGFLTGLLFAQAARETSEVSS